MTHEPGVSDLVAALRDLLADFPACSTVSASVVTFDGMLATLAVTREFVTIADENGRIHFVLEQK